MPVHAGPMIRSRLATLIVLVTVSLVVASGGSGHATARPAAQQRVATAGEMVPGAASPAGLEARTDAAGSSPTSVAVPSALAGGSSPVATSVAVPPALASASSPPAQPSASCRQRASPRSGWSWPVDPPVRVLVGFDPPDVRWGAGHRGIDLAASIGESIRAPADGVVSFAGSVAGRPVLVVAHAGGLRSTFEPVLATVSVGQRVTRASIVGSLDGTPGHCAPQSCLHWGVLRGKAYVDPLGLLCGQVVLKPMS